MDDKDELIQRLLAAHAIDEDIAQEIFKTFKDEDEQLQHNLLWSSTLEKNPYREMGTIFTDKHGRELKRITTHSGEHFVKYEVFHNDIPIKKSQLGKLTPKDKEELEFYEEEIRKGDEHFLRAGMALLFIWKKRLYRGEASTFKGYLADKWGMSRPRGYQLILAATIFAELKHAGVEVGLKSVAPLLALKGLNPEYAAQAYTQAKSEMEDGKEPPAWKIKNSIKQLKLKVKKKNKNKDEPEDDDTEPPEVGIIRDFKRDLVPIKSTIEYWFGDEPSGALSIRRKCCTEMKELLHELVAVLDDWDSKYGKKSEE